MKKNFKRLLCLVLVVSLVCSLGVTAFAANSSLTSYNDVDDIEYVEAVDVLTGLGILEGTNGSFSPSDNMTRDQAAKIIAYLKLGAETAASLSATSAPFDDVPLTHWAVGYIAYCASAGIIDGDGTGNFNPEDEVTAYQFGKMLLCTLGYGVNGEYIGASWAVNVAAAAGSLGIYSGKSGSLSGNTAITRDEMALYAFNTLTGAAQVNYNENFGEYYVGTSALNSISTTIKDKYKYEDYIDGDNDETAYEYTIGYLTYDLTKSGEKGGNENDAFGRPCYSWESDDAEISDTYVDDDPDYTFSNFVEAQTIYKEIGSTIANDYVWTIWEDGKEQDVTYNDSDDPDSTDNQIAIKNDDSKVVPRGTTLELYVDDSAKTVLAVKINTYLGQITDVDGEDDDIEITLDVYGLSSEEELTIDTDNASNLAGFAEDDWVIVTWSDEESDEAQSITAATVVEGVATAYTSDSVTIDGTKYNNSGTFNNKSGHSQWSNFDDAYDSKDFDTTFVVYVDTYGNMIGFEEADGSNSSSVSAKSYLYVESAKATAYDGFDDAEVKVKASFTDGTTQTIYLKVNDADDEGAYVKVGNNDSNSTEQIYITTSAYGGNNEESQLVFKDGSTVSGHIYSYTKNSSGYYTLNKLGNNASEYSGVVVDDVSAVTFNGPSATLYANSSTKLVLVDDQKIYTGYSNFPDEDFSSDADAVLAITASSGSTRLTYVYVFGDDVSSTDNLIYAMWNGTSDVAYTENDTVTAVFWVNGSKVTYEFDNDDDLYNDSGELTRYEAGWIEIGSDGLAEFTPYSDKSTYDKDNYLYVGTVTDKDGDTLTVNIGGVTYYFTMADDCETTRIKSGNSGNSSSASTDDLVWVYTEDPAVAATDASGNIVSYSAEAVATLAIDPGNNYYPSTFLS
ncbi:MAG: S-layer homology domain-containing protein [Oscillospiraceae bacterium]|nr:S-layer homology domain-containing protein [Oscillospiraceae bacterium]